MPEDTAQTLESQFDKFMEAYLRRHPLPVTPVSDEIAVLSKRFSEFAIDYERRHATLSERMASVEVYTKTVATREDTVRLTVAVETLRGALDEFKAGKFPERVSKLESRFDDSNKKLEQSGKDLRSLLMPVLSNMLGGGLMLAIYVLAGHALGLLH